MSRLREQVTEFHRAIGAPVRTTPTIPPREEVLLRARLITEEYFETMRALVGGDDALDGAEHAIGESLASNLPVEPDVVALADGLADLDYVVEGTRLAFGINGGPIAQQVHVSNMRKVSAPKDASGKQTKPEGWTPPDIAGRLRAQGWKP